MTADQYITMAILALTFALLIKSKIPPVAVFVGALTLTITFRLAPVLSEKRHTVLGVQMGQLFPYAYPTRPGPACGQAHLR